ncbi:unnamed protein product [Candidula unifasciata]|uniref:Mitochondrial inner membrane protease ATP23 n=1 Tax=Candidula unifasciata TaxID=100452 RepID=A0A8S3Z8F7_9EUPU|nr:unnamed protein product [Candidula unifasciata]
MAASAKSPTDQDEKQTNENTNANAQKSEDTKEDFGYYFYPDRDKKKKKSFLERAWLREDVHHFKCETHVRSCMESNPKVKLLAGALESYGCPVDVKRHISCETCIRGVSGGFDPKSMQVVLCQNTIQNRDICCNIIGHELLHAFDFCRAKVDFTNLRHLACTEIRAANMFHCSLGASFASGEASFFNIKERHQLCVKNKALQSIRLVRNVTELEAMTVVDEVFDKCYNDTEPIGRRCFKNTGRAKRALEESRNYYDFD